VKHKRTISLFLLLLVMMILVNPGSFSLSSDEKIMNNSLEIDKITSIMQQINQNHLEENLYDLYNITMEYGDRMTGSEGSYQARKYVIDRLKHNGNDLNVVQSNWTMLGGFWHPGLFSDANICIEIPGQLDQASTVLFFVHYDTIEGSLGADDDGSGVAAFIRIAEVLTQYQFNHTIILCASSGEEMGDLGDYYEANYFYDTNRDIIAAITADAIGYMPAGDHPNKNSLVLYSPDRSAWIIDEILETYDIYEDSVGLDSIRLGNFYGNSGNRAYDNYGYSTVKFFEGITNPGWENPPHTNDTIEYINFSYLTNVTKLIAGSLASIADMPPFSPTIQIISPREDSLYFNDHRINFIPLCRGKTLSIGNRLTIHADVKTLYNEGIDSVKFELITGDNDMNPGDEERKVIATDSDDTAPYTFFIDESVRIGWHTVRATVFSPSKSDFIDEIEIFLCNIY
jgi:hypothetical protein